MGDLRRYTSKKNKKGSGMGLVQDCCHLALQQFSCDYNSFATDVSVEVLFEKTIIYLKLQFCQVEGCTVTTLPVQLFG